MERLKWFLVWLLLSKKQRSIIASMVKGHLDYAIENYSMVMGETYNEFIEILLKIPIK